MHDDDAQLLQVSVGLGLLADRMSAGEERRGCPSRDTTLSVTLILSILGNRIAELDEPDDETKRIALEHLSVVETMMGADDGDPCQALSHAFRGLVSWPHSERLWLDVGKLTIALGWAELAMNVLSFVSKNYPWNEDARQLFTRLHACFMGD